jgi:uncharacterized membrane protein
MPVQAQSINAVPDSGTADAGIASRPIANVAANDTVNGAPATLGKSRNASVAKVGTWPTGIALTAATGSVTTSTAVSPGIYSIQYKLCDKKTPPDCATTTDTITVITASIAAVPDTGNADAGIASIPIAHVAANDTVNGAPATLGTSGNASVAKVGTWPTGIVLTAATGSVTTSATVLPGIYSIQYKLCDKNTPPDCAIATDTITVIAASIAAVPDTGNADAGIASTPIAHVAANDTVNGAPATLGTSGNASVAKVGTWPTGLALTAASGSVTTSATVLPGIYSIQYKLCDKNTPPDCATTTDTVTVIAPSIAPVPDHGIAIVGTASTAISNVAANDTVNGAPATLGTSGNATIAQIGNWPTGIALDTLTGAVITANSVPAGTYQLQYQLCDKNTPANCGTATDTALVTPAFTEVQVSTFDFGDIEFDWGRDGVYCATCNYGQGNARFNWPDQNGNIWLGHLDPTTGAFTPPAGNNELVDTTDLYVLNGPEWAFSTQDGQVISQLIYTRYTPGQPAITANAGVAFATPFAGGWTANFLPGAGPASGGAMNTVDPIATQCNTDPIALALFNDLASPQDVFWEPITIATETAPNLTPFGPYFSAISGGKPGARWVPCTHQLVFIGAAPPDASGNVYQQVFWYDTDSQVVQQLTVDSRGHAEAFMFQAPEFNDNYVFYTTSGDAEIDVYEQTGVGSNGAPTFQLVNQITSPDSTEPYISSTESFINCTPTCQTYIFMKLSSEVIGPRNRLQVANGVAVANINPAQPLFEILVPNWATPTIQRTDLEYYITTTGPYLYYGSNTVSSNTTSLQILGHWYIDMQLGAPSGACVGSSAEGGMLPGC